jgi:DNA topoisomerase-1
MSGSLIIVESPTKIKTIKKYLGSEFEVKASLGHVKDLPKSKLGIDIEKDFEPAYEIIKEKRKVISELKKSAKKADKIYLAPDPDREGEAIAWHVAQEIGTKDKTLYRVLFNDLTKNTVLSAINNPLKLDPEKYEAQQTRRILDRLVGYQVSPILWDKVRRGLSAGRVQTVAVRIICEREEEIRNFTEEEFWNITALLEGQNPPPFEARLVKINSKKAKVENGVQAEEIIASLKETPFIVNKVEKKEIKRFAPPPFTTSKLQQEASRRFRFSANKTMRTAQKLYEGIAIGAEGSVGLITYMRTDSVRIASEALDEAREYILNQYGKDFLPGKARVFKSPKKSQDAHEAIRPASMAYKPQDIKSYLENDEYRLYQLIWNRFVASQMNPALFDQTKIDITAGSYFFNTKGAIMKSPGHTILYTESKEENGEENGAEKVLPEISEGEGLKLLSLTPEQNFTQPPPRFSEATLVRELEEKGLGRPSTYAAILSTIQNREYAKLERGRFHPTETGELVNELLVKNFSHVFDVKFTASMEDKLDLIEEGKLSRDKTLREFYTTFAPDLEAAKEQMRNVKREETPTEITCDKCGNPMVIKWGRNGRFLACSNYPECKNTANIATDEKGEIGTASEQVTDTICDLCGKNMVIKEGRFGRFLGCSGYPDCKNTKPLDTGIGCPEEGCEGTLCERRTRKGKIFYSCSNYPDCSYALWDKPLPEKCPQCDHPFLVEKYYRGKGVAKICPNKECGYKEGR